MALQKYCGFVEINRIAVGIFPLLLGTAYAKYRFGTLFHENLALLSASLFCLAAALMAADNCRREFALRGGCPHGPYPPIGRGKAVAITAMLFAVSAVTGLLLFRNTDWGVLPGGLFYAVGVVAAFGLFRARSPVFRWAGGIVLGCLVPFLAVYIHTWELDLYRPGLPGEELWAAVSLPEAGRLALFTLPGMTGTAGILPAVQRGGEKALPMGGALFGGLYLAGFAAIPAAVATGAAPPAYLLSLAAVWPVWKNTEQVLHGQDGGDAMPPTVRGYIWLESLRLAAYGVGIWIG